MLRHFLVDTDLSPQEQDQVLDLAAALKADRFSRRPLAGPQTVGVIFDKTSTRTRVSFATGIADLGGNPLIINPGESQLGHKETIADSSRVFSRMLAAVVWRTFKQSGVEEMAEYSSVPVINGLSDDYHPCQILADLLTLRERLGDVTGRALAYVGDAANNMANSYMLGCATAGMHVRIAGPASHLPSQDVVDAARERAAGTGGSVVVTTDVGEALAGAHAVVTDTWISMGQEAEKADRAEIFRPYSVTAGAMAQAAENAVFLHCLPAYRGLEVSAEVFDGPASLVWDEAENRVHAQKALLTWLLDSSGLSADRPPSLRRAGGRQ